MTMITVVVVPSREDKPITTVEVRHNHMPDFEALTGGLSNLVRIGISEAMLHSRVLTPEMGPNLRASHFLRDRDIYPDLLPHWLGDVVLTGVDQYGVFTSCPVLVVAALVTTTTTLTPTAYIDQLYVS